MLSNRRVYAEIPVIEAASNGNVAQLKELVEKGENIEECDNAGWTAVHHAAFGGHTEVLEYLKNITDLHFLCAADGHGETAVHQAAASGHTKVLEYLMENKVPLDTTDKVGQTAVHVAAANGQKEVLEYLKKNNVPLDTSDINRQTAVHHAAAGGHAEVLEFLKNNIPDLDTINNDGDSPAHLAAKYGYTDCLLVLIKARVSMEIKNKNGHTPMDILDKDIGDSYWREQRAQSLKAVQEYLVKRNETNHSETQKQQPQAPTLNRDKIDILKGKITNFIQQSRNRGVQGIIFVFGVTGADGTDRDVENIEATFKELNFAIYSEFDPLAEDIACTMQAAAELKYPYKYAYIAFYFAGHGGRDKDGKMFILGYQREETDTEILYIEDYIINPLKVHHEKISRLFFFDCCQSEGHGTAFRSTIHKKPKAHSGELIAYATNEGQKSWGDRRNGGIWTYHLCKNLRQYHEPILTILGMTFDDVTRARESFQEPLIVCSFGSRILKPQGNSTDDAILSHTATVHAASSDEAPQ